jgi:hypothetical protein
MKRRTFLCALLAAPAVAAVASLPVAAESAPVAVPVPNPAEVEAARQKALHSLAEYDAWLEQVGHPPVVLTSPYDDPPHISLTPGAVNYLREGERIEYIGPSPAFVRQMVETGVIDTATAAQWLCLDVPVNTRIIGWDENGLTETLVVAE